MSTNTARIAALEVSVVDIKASLVETHVGINAILAHLGINQPAAVSAEPTVVAVVAGQAPVAAVAEAPFVEWIRETAPARKARKESNADMSAWLQSKGLPIGGPVWEACSK